jgi:DNA-binding MarR family transcriptional regulator
MTTALTQDQIAAIAEALRDLQRLRASRKVHAALAEATEVDLSQQAVQVLVALDDTLPVAQLARAARMDIGAVSRQLRVLEDEGFLKRSPSPDNASVVLVSSTARGRAVAARITASRNDHLARALTAWSPDDRVALATLLGRLVDDLQATPYTDPTARAGGVRR